MLLLFLVAFSLVLTGHGSCQGLYFIEPVSGQLVLVDWVTNARTNVGSGLQQFGYTVPSDCTPTTVDTTGKWIYTLAHKAGSAVWSVVAMELADGTIRKTYQLPADWPASLSACDHGLTEDSGWHVYVTAVTRDAAPRLLMAKMTYTWPESNSTQTIANVSLSSLGMGSAPRTMASTVTGNTVWFGLTGGLVGLDLAAGRLTRRLPLPSGAALTGLQYDTVGQPRNTYGVLVTADGRSAIASFVDDGAGVPVLETVALDGSVPPPDTASAVTVMDDQDALALLSGTALRTVGLRNGTLLTSVAVTGTPPIAIGYEPFVFSSAPSRI